MEKSKQNHVSVLLKESIDGLQIKKDGIYVDATLGRGGHSLQILKRLSNLGMLYAFDQDLEALEISKLRLSTLSPRYELIHANFVNITEELAKRNIHQVDGILFDLGVSSPQLDNSSRGFSYMKDAKLDMRMDQTKTLDAYTVVNTYKEADLRKILFEYGEERYARQIARNIVLQRNIKKIETTLELVDVIKKSMPSSALRDGHPAKRTFQAIRIEVNNELENLEVALKKSLKLLNCGGRIAVITFHSLEDKIVKKIFLEATKGETWNRNKPISLDTKKVEYKLVNKKVIVPTRKELEVNKRSNSAKLRIIEKI